MNGLAVVASLALLASMYAVGFRLHNIAALAPSEVGGWLSGFVSALAFIWLLAGFHLQRQQLNAQREEFRRMAIVNCTAEVGRIVQSTVDAEVEAFKLSFPVNQGTSIGFAFLTHTIIRRKEYLPTSTTASNAVSDEELRHAIYAVDICIEAMYQACKLYIEVVKGDSSYAPHVSSMSRRAALVIRVIDAEKLVYVSRYRRALLRLSEAEVDDFLAGYNRLFDESGGAIYKIPRTG